MEDVISNELAVLFLQVKIPNDVMISQTQC